MNLKQAKFAESRVGAGDDIRLVSRREDGQKGTVEKRESLFGGILR